MSTSIAASRTTAAVVGRGTAFAARNVAVGFVLGGLAIGCSGTRSPYVGCEKDVDCKGERICQEAVCEDPKGPVKSAGEDASADQQGLRHERWFRGGPGHGGTSPYLGPRSRPTLAWDIDLGSVIFATATIGVDAAGDAVAFVGTHGGRFVGVSVAGPKAGAVVMDLDLGGRIWGTAAVDGKGSLYVGNDKDKLFGIDPVTKTIRWSVTLGDCSPTRAPGPEGARCDVDGGPTLGPDGDLYVGADGLYRISSEGEIRWHWSNLGEAESPTKDKKKGAFHKPKSAEKAAHVFSSPLVSADGKIYFGGQDGYITSLSAEGELRWRHRVGSGADVDGSPAWDDNGGIVVGADDGRVYALRSDGSLRWSFLTKKDIRSSMGISASGTVYATSFDHNLYAIAPSGAVHWVLETGGMIHASPVVDRGGTIYFGSQDEHLYSVSSEGEVLWKIELPGDIDSSVAITAEGTLIVGCDDGHLRAFVRA